MRGPAVGRCNRHAVESEGTHGSARKAVGTPASWLVRGDARTDPSGLAFGLSFAGGGLAMLTGWLGGELVARLSVGIDDGAHLNAPSSLSGLPATHSISTQGTR